MTHFLIRAVAFTHTHPPLTAAAGDDVTHEKFRYREVWLRFRGGSVHVLRKKQWQLCVTQRVSLMSEVQRRSETPALVFTRCWAFLMLFLFNSLFFLFSVSVSFSFPYLKSSFFNLCFCCCYQHFIIAQLPA